VGWTAPALLLTGVPMLAIPRLIAGAQGLPRIADAYLPRFQWAQIVSGCGLAFIVAAVALTAAGWLRSLQLR
jgi:hypothetical protein